MTNDQFPDVPDLSDVTAANDRVRPPSLRETCVEIAQLTRRKAETNPKIRAASADTIQVVIEAYWELLLRETIRTGRMRLPGGWGSFFLQHIKGSATPRQVPGVGEVPREASVRIKYAGGVAVDDLLQRQGSAAYNAKRVRDREYLFPDIAVPSAKDLVDDVPPEH